ncbi:MAG TPA: BatA domain-containing protein [Bacteroidales bacterium]|nr:BatA domain-containing protein [Bacteroidales bacterium]
MSFLYPYMLWGLAAVSIPVIIHLFNFRQFRKVYFTNVRFLDELKQQTRRQSQLRHLLVMISRMLAIASLVLAFARPYIPVEKEMTPPQAVNQVSIYIDNSFSMEALSSAGPLLEVARNAAREIAAGYKSTDRFMLTVNEFEGRHQRWVNRDEFLQMIGEIVPTPAVRTLSEVIRRQQNSLTGSHGESVTSYLISDFQTSMADLENVKPDSLNPLFLVPLQAVRSENLYIDSCWFVSPVHQIDQGVKLVARVVNDSRTDYEKVPLKLSVNGLQKAVASFDITAGTNYDVEIPFTNHEPGIQLGIVEITDYPVVFDDQMFIVYNVAGSIPVLAINGNQESPFLNSLFGKDPEFGFVNNPLGNIDYNRLREFELIILNEVENLSTGLIQELTIYLENGGSLLIIPSEKLDIGSYTDFLQSVNVNFYGEFTRELTRVTEIDRDNPVFADVFERNVASERGGNTMDLPEVRSFFPVTRNARTAQVPVMTMQNGKPFLTMEKAGKGLVYLLAVPLAESSGNFARHAIFVPALYRIALLSAASDPLYFVIGRDNRVSMSNPMLSGDYVLRIVSSGGDYEFIPGMQTQNNLFNILINNQIRSAGHYFVRKGEEDIKGLGFNYDRNESVMEFSGAEELNRMIDKYGFSRMRVISEDGKPLAESVKDMNQGTVLWRLFIILALVFLAFEIVLLRYWKLKS